MEMSYTLPSLKVRQVFEPVLDAGGTPLAALVIGPQYGLHKPGEAGETLLGAYDRSVGFTDASYPGKEAGSVIDTEWGGVYVDDAFVRYANNLATEAVVTGGNLVSSNSLVFKTANGYERSAIFGTRDVAIGDRFEATYGASSVSGVITGLVADVDPSTLGDVEARDGNQEASSAASNVSADPGNTTSDVDVAAGGSYDGLADGKPSEVYSVTVVTGGAFGVAALEIISASGTDDVASPVVVQDGVAVNLGTRGATLTFSESLATGASPDFVAGDIWTVAISQNFTPALMDASAGSYTGPVDTVYYVRIQEGGEVGTDDVKFDVHTTNGVDHQPVTTVVPDTEMEVGSRGLILEFSTGDQYCTGDVFVIAATAEAPGVVNTLVLSTRLTGVVALDAVTIALGLNPGLSAVQPAYWTLTSTGVTVAPAATVAGAWLGTSATFPIMVGDIHVRYRELMAAQAGVLGSVRTPGDVLDYLGSPEVANPLALHANAAVTTAGGVPVYYIGVASDNLAGYQEALKVAENSRAPYSLVPCTLDNAVKGAIKAHVLSMSTPEIGMWRIAWFGANAVDEGHVDVNAEEASLDGRNLTSADALFVSSGVKAGDTVRIGYEFDAYDNEVYKTYTIDAVLSETELRLLTVPDLPQGVDLKFEVWYNLTDSQLANAIAAEAGEHANRRIRLLWGENPRTSGIASVPMSVLAAAAAGQRASAAPHQPLTNVELDGIVVDVPRFGRQNLDVMAGGGVWIVTRDQNGPAYNRHQVTTATTDINHREDSVTTNLDHISRDYRSALSGFYGRGNVSNEMVVMLEATMDQVESTIVSRIYPRFLGPQIQAIEERSVTRDPAVRDRITIKLVPVLPYPLNDLDLTIVIQ